MLYAVIGLIVLASIGLAAYALIDKSELVSRIAALQSEVQEQESAYTVEIEGLRAELAKLDKIRHIPDVLAKSKALEAEIASKLEQAQKEADETVLVAHKEAERMKVRIAARVQQAEQRAHDIIVSATREANDLKSRSIDEIAGEVVKAKEVRRVAEWQANNVIEQAQKEAKEIASKARKEAKEKTGKIDEILDRATAYALDIRQKAERRVGEIAGKAYEAMRRHDHYEAAARAIENVVNGYGGTYLIPAAHVLDELAEEYGFHKAGERLKLARKRTKIMEKNGTAATCNYPEGWKRDYAINFVLSAFNGKVDSILARVKPANQGKLIQEIKDIFALVNHNGEVFRNARVQEEFLDARLEELRWAVAVQRFKEREREEQRAVKEQMREEERARKEYEEAIRQAEREEKLRAKELEKARQEYNATAAEERAKYESKRRELEEKLKEEKLLTEALEKARQEYNAAAAEDRAKYESRRRELEEKLKEAEERNRRALSMAQQTKCGHVYVISNVGSFGEDIYKIGLTRRLDPLERVRELGSASVPFAFDVHAMIYSEDSPALEAALHRRFSQAQVNKVNRRKEFFRLRLQDIRNVIDEMELEVKWTMAAEAKDYRETLALEHQMQEDPEFRKQWAASEAAYQAHLPFDDDEDESSQEDEDQDRLEESQPAVGLGTTAPERS